MLATVKQVAHRLLPDPVIDVMYQWRFGKPSTKMYSGPDETHPERLLILPYVTGRCVEVGSGHRKTAESVIAVDHVRTGQVGNVSGRAISLDVQSVGEALPFASASFDSLIARHNLEHYIDTAGVLAEWKRVLKPGGTLAVILPDEEHYHGRTVDMDPTHFHAYTRGALARLCELVGFDVVRTDTALDQWSFLLVATA